MLDRPRQPKDHDLAIIEAIRKAQRLLDECNVTSIPVDLVRLAQRQGIHRIREMETALDGQLLELEGGGYEVILGKNAPLTRKRFTLAHEIGHTLLQGSEKLSCGGGAIEELCNVAAAELLIPGRFLRKLFPETNDVTVESFLKVSKLCRCSLEATGWKLLNCGVIKGSLLIWKVKSQAETEMLELLSVPHTWGLHQPFKTGMMVHPRTVLWQALMAEEAGLIGLQENESGENHQGERIRLGKTLLVLIRFGTNLHTQIRYPERPAIQELLPF